MVPFKPQILGARQTISGVYTLHCSRYDSSWKDFTERAVQANDKELVAKISIVEKYTSKLPGYIKILEEQAQYSIVDPRWLISDLKSN